MKITRTRIPLIVGACLLAMMSNSPADGQAQLGGMKLLEGYQHQPLQGIDSKVGKIFSKDGLEIHYEIGTLPKPEGPRMGGQFTDRPKLTPKSQLRWYQEQIVCGMSVHLAHRKDNVLLVSFPQMGTNFRVMIATQKEMAEALLMILTYPQQNEGRTSRSRASPGSAVPVALPPVGLSGLLRL